MKREFEGAEKILSEYRALANSPFYDQDKAVKVHADAIVLKAILEVRDLLIYIYSEISDGKVDTSGRLPS